MNEIEVKTVVLKSWEQELREWYAANPPNGKLVYHYCERMTACSTQMEADLFNEIYQKLVAPGSKIKAVKLEITFGETMCKPTDQFVKELGRMEAYRRAKPIVLWVREVHVSDGLIKLVAREDMTSYAGISMEFTKWQDSNKVRNFLRGLPSRFGEIKHRNDFWR